MYTYWQMSKEEVRMDVDEQTAQDYSIVVRNPPDDAVDPHEWVKFFQDVVGANFPSNNNNSGKDGSGDDNGDDDDDSCKHVTCCTVVIDNKKLMKTLVERRGVLKSLDDTLELMTDEQYNQLGFNISINKMLYYERSWVRTFLFTVHWFIIAGISKRNSSQNASSALKND